MIRWGLALILGVASVAGAGEPVATFSIVAADPETGEVGVAVQSKFFAVGSVVPWARAGVGAVATQSYANTTYGPLGLDLLAAGRTAEEAITALTEDDPGAASRQVAIVTPDGVAAAFTGSECLDWAGHRVGRHHSAQGNILAGQAVVDAMSEAFEASTGPLAERLVTALEAGQAAGGDVRGQQSAAILIMKDGAGYGGYNDRYCDLRVDDHETPIAELRRLVTQWSWFAAVLDGYRFAEAGDHDAAAEAGARILELRPRDGETHYHIACYHAKAGEHDQALAALREALVRKPDLKGQALLDGDLAPLRERPEFQAMTTD